MAPPSSIQQTGAECLVVDRGGMAVATIVFRVRDAAAVQAALGRAVPSVEVLRGGAGELAYVLAFPGDPVGHLGAEIAPDRVPVLLETQRLLATIPTFVKDERGATLNLQEYVEDLTHDFSGRYADARAAFDAGRVEEASRVLRALCAEHAGALPHAHALLGRAEAAAGRLDEAQAALVEAVAAARTTRGAIARGAAPALRALVDALAASGRPSPLDPAATADLGRASAPAPARPPAPAEPPAAPGRTLGERWLTLGSIALLLAVAAAMAFAPSAAPPAASSRADSDQERSVAGPGSATPRVAASSTEKPPGSQGAAAGSKELASLRAPARALVTASAVLPSPIAERSPLAGWIRRAPIAGGAPEVVVGRVNGAVGFVVDASHVYWIEGRFGSEKGKVLRAPKHGGTPELMLEDCAPTSLAVDETTVYVASSGCERTCGGGGIYAVPKGGGPARALAERVGNPAGLVAVGSALYWSGQLGCGFDGTVRLAKSGGAPKSVYGGGDLPFAIDGDRVFVGSLWTLFSGALATGATVATVDFKGDADGRSNIGGIAVDGESVYLTTFGGGTVERWSKTGGSVRRLATLGGRPKSVALAARHLFVADPYVDLVWRLPKEGGDPAVFARESASPEKVVVHENYVYWITR